MRCSSSASKSTAACSHASRASKLPDMPEHLVFVFGTLKEGFPNFATNRGKRLPGAYVTREPYPLPRVGERHSPWMLDLPGEGHPVSGQVFAVDDETLAAM